MIGKRSLLFRCLLVLTVAATACRGQSRYPHSPGLDNQSSPSPLPSNTVSHLVPRGQILWAGTSKGAARTSDGGTAWESFRADPAFASPGIFALAILGDTVWCSTGFTKDVDGSSVQTGSGYAFSTDNGVSWTGRTQALDARGDSLVPYGPGTVRFLPVIVPEQNVTFDVALSGGTVWIASWASGLRRSTDLGESWKRVVLPSRNRRTISPSDTLTGYTVDPRQDNNFLAFSVYAQSDSVIWAGTAGGVNRSTDGGVSWTKFRSDNQNSPILADWVIAIAGQKRAGGTRIWITNWPAEGPDQRYGVSYTDNEGASWSTTLPGIKAYAFAFKDSIVYVATDDGIYRTADAGRTWSASGTIIDASTGERITSSAFFSVAVIGDTVFAGGNDGFVRTVDSPVSQFGQTWRVIRAHRTLASTADTYAYPNPFSPRSDVTRIRHSPAGPGDRVTVEIYDFGMNRVRTLIKDASRSGSGQQDEIWDGRNDGGTTVPNGVYFYRVTADGGEPAWGKIMVLQ